MSNQKTTLGKQFSVVIPLYNKEAHIRATVESVLSQTFDDFEVIIVDDGSTDKSLEVVRAMQDSRLQIIHQKNEGVSAARNTGIKAATGEYVALLDADDHWYPWHLEEMSALIKEFPGKGLYSAAHEIYRNGQVYLPSQPDGLMTRSEITNFYDTFSISLSLVNSTTACIPREILRKIDGFPVGVKVGEDIYVWIKAAEIGGLAYNKKMCARYNKDAENRSDLGNDGEIPYYLVWLDQALKEGGIGDGHIEGAQRFLEKGIFYQAAGFKLNGNGMSLTNIARLDGAKSFRMRLALMAISITPKALLSAAQSFRHSQSS